MNRLDIEWKILQYSRQLPESGLLEALHYLEFLSQKNELQSKPIKHFNTMKVQQVIVVSREELHEH